MMESGRRFFWGKYQFLIDKVINHLSSNLKREVNFPSALPVQYLCLSEGVQPQSMTIRPKKTS